jgi:hypothetical protein
MTAQFQFKAKGMANKVLIMASARMYVNNIVPPFSTFSYNFNFHSLILIFNLSNCINVIMESRDSI